MSKSESKMLSSIICPIQCTVALGAWSLHQLKVFLPLKKKRLLEHTIGSKVSALARLTLGENLFNSQEKSVRCLHQWVSILSGLNLEKI